DLYHPGMAGYMCCVPNRNIEDSGGDSMETIMRDRRAILVFVGPALLFYTIIVLVPIIWSVVYTVFEGNVIGGFTFVGFNNYTTLIRDPAFWQAFFFTLKYSVVVTAGQVGVGLLLALLYIFYLRKSSPM